MHERRYAGVIAVHQDRIVLVRERFEHWGGDFWIIPSGMVEWHERPEVGAARELTEETGLIALASDLELVSTSATGCGDHRSLAWNFKTTVRNSDFAVDDPDDSVLEARWFDLDESLTLWRRFPYPPLAEPIIGYLDGSAEVGSHWVYPSADLEPTVTATR